MGGPHDAGGYNSRFWDTGFFSDCGRWRTPYGEFFLKWYSQSLLDYADSFLAAVGPVLQKRCPGIVLDTVNEVCFQPLLCCFTTHVLSCKYEVLTAAQSAVIVYAPDRITKDDDAER